jgi:hypothetical protein
MLKFGASCDAYKNRVNAAHRLPDQVGSRFCFLTFFATSPIAFICGCLHITLER